MQVGFGARALLCVKNSTIARCDNFVWRFKHLYVNSVLIFSYLATICCIRESAHDLQQKQNLRNHPQISTVWMLEGHALFSHKARNQKEKQIHNDHNLHYSRVNKTDSYANRQFLSEVMTRETQRKGWMAWSEDARIMLSKTTFIRALNPIPEWPWKRPSICMVLIHGEMQRGRAVFFISGTLTVFWPCFKTDACIFWQANVAQTYKHFKTYTNRRLVHSCRATCNNI